MNVAELCSRHVITVDAQASLQQAALLMREHHVGALVVIRRDEAGPHVQGVVTDRDLAIEVLARGTDAEQPAVAELAHGPLASVSEDADLAEAIERMQGAGVRRLLVHDAQGQLTGLLSFDDVLPACVTPLAGLAEVLRRGLAREVSERSAVAAPPRPPVRVPAMGTAGWRMV